MQMAKPGVTEFSTRWELIVDLFLELTQEGFEVVIPLALEEDSIVLEYFAQQGVDLASEHECYVYLLGMANTIENLLNAYKFELVSKNELMNAITAMMQVLAYIRPFIPEDIFIQYLNIAVPDDV